MDTNYIGTPSDFRRTEGSEATDFRHTFDLNGIKNDEMLRLYLRSAGLSDEIEYLTAEQRRAFIYDIIRSNKLPGFWLPSTFKKTTSKMQRPQIQPPPPPMQLSVATTPNVERRNQNATNSLGYACIRSTAFCNSLDSLDRASPILPQHFIPAPSTPPSPTSFIISAKGNRYEISGPMNFQHTAGDMTRDRTRNAFDLSSSSNDNVLRKYMMERGITEEDVAGMRKTDIIRKIVQSKFTWMPPKDRNANTAVQQQLNYATICGSNDSKSMSSSPSYEELSIPSPAISPTATLSRPQIDFSNFTLVTSRFADVTKFPSPNELCSGINESSSSNVATIALPPLPPNAKRPAPPPRKSQQAIAIEHECEEQAFAINPQPYVEIIHRTSVVADYDNAFETIPIKRNDIENQQINMPSSFKQLTEPLYVTKQKPSNTKTYLSTPTAPKTMTNIPPSSPYMPTALNALNKPVARPPSAANIRNTTTKAQPLLTLPPQVKLSMKNSPPPPPQISNKPKLSAMLLPPPPPPILKSTDTLPTPSPITSLTDLTQSNPNQAVPQNNAFLESIRKGVPLKKVDQTATTISGVKPRAERKAPVTDLLSELKLSVTLRRVKNPVDNPFSDEETPGESLA